MTKSRFGIFRFLNNLISIWTTVHRDLRYICLIWHKSQKMHLAIFLEIACGRLLDKTSFDVGSFWKIKQGDKSVKSETVFIFNFLTIYQRLSSVTFQNCYFKYFLQIARSAVKSTSSLSNVFVYIIELLERRMSKIVIERKRKKNVNCF